MKVIDDELASLLEGDAAQDWEAAFQKLTERLQILPSGLPRQEQ